MIFKYFIFFFKLYIYTLMNKNIYVISILLLILFYFIYIKNKETFLDFFDSDEDKEEDKNKNNLKLINFVQDKTVIKDISQNFNEITHIPEFVNTDFNYNDFEFEFSINRNDKMITDLEGGILTLGNTGTNIHNLFIYIKKLELIIGLVGYNTHISINLNNIKTVSTLTIKLIYRNPYINIYISGSDQEKSYNGYLDYLGNINETPNTNFRLYFHPLKNSWCSIGTVNFIKANYNLNSAIGILNKVDTVISDIKINHKERNLFKLQESSGIRSITHYNKLNIDMNNILIMNLDLDTNINMNALLFKIFTKKRMYVGLEKRENILKLNLYNNRSRSTLVEINYEDNIENLYIEFIPYMNLHLFTIYINDNFYKYIIDISPLKNIKNNKIIFTDITINDNNNIINTSVINKISLYTEILPLNINLLTEKKLEPTVKKLNDYLLKMTFDKNIKLEYFKLLKMNNINYKLYIKNIFTNTWKLIYKLKINDTNKNLFINKNLQINDNLTSNQYKLEIYSNFYELEPLNAKLDIDNTIMEENIDNMKITGKGSKSKLEFGDSTKWIFDNITGNLFNIYTNKPGIQNSLINTDQYIVEKKPNTDNIIYIKTKNNNKYLGIGKNEGAIEEFNDKINCEFKKIPINNISLDESINELIELYGIEDPFPKLYINNNDLSQSTAPCSYIYSQENQIIEELQSNIVNIDQAYDKPESVDFLNNVAKYMIPDKRKNLPQNIINDIKNNEKLKFVMSKVDGDIFNKNKIYNFCSNNLQHFNNKMYSYNYSKQRYYYQDPKQVYNYKQRIMLGELSKEELELLLNINKLKSGFNFIGMSNNKNLTNTSVFPDLIDLWSNKNENFTLEWNYNEPFNSGVEVNIKINNNGSPGVLKNIYISENIFEEEEIKDLMTENNEKIYNTIKKELDQIRKNKIYTHIDYDYEEITLEEFEKLSTEIKPPETQSEKDKAEKRLGDKEVEINLLKPPTPIECNVDSLPIDYAKEVKTVNKLFIKNIWTPNKAFKGAVKFLNKYGSQTGGSINNSYTHYTKDRTKFETNIINSIFTNSLSKKINNKNLVEHYIDKAIPKIILETNETILNSKTKYWRLEWQGTYKPEITEFHLFSIIKKKYLINKNNNLEWSDNHAEGYGWKLKDNNILATSLISEEDKEKNKEIYKQQVNEQIIKKTYNKAKTEPVNKNIKILVNNFNEKTKKLETKFKVIIEDHLEKQREKDLKKLSQKTGGIHLFSPTIGPYGKFLKLPSWLKDKKAVTKFKKEKIKKSSETNDNIAFYWNWTTNNSNSNINIDIFSSYGPDTDKIISRKIDCKSRNKTDDWKKTNCKDNNIVLISTKIDGKNLYLKNKPDKKNRLEWLVPDNFNNDFKWILEWDEKLYLDINKKNINYTTNIAKENILQEYFISENKNVTINVGIKITAISDKHTWVDVYDAIKWAANQGKKGCLDYAWITKGSNNKAVYYDDNHMLSSSSNRNTLTTGWFILHRDKRFSRLYLDYNNLLYTLYHNKRHTKKRCKLEARRSCGYGCSEKYCWKYYPKDTWTSHGKSKGVDKWLSEEKIKKKTSAWHSRRENMFNLIEDYKPCADSIIKPTPIYFKSYSNKEYLRSDSSDFMKFNISKDFNKCAWYLLLKMKESEWLTNYNNTIVNAPKYQLVKAGVDCGDQLTKWHYVRNKGDEGEWPKNLKECYKGVSQHSNWESGMEWFQFTSADTSYNCYFLKYKHGCIDPDTGESLLNHPDVSNDNPADNKWNLYKFDSEF